MAACVGSKKPSELFLEFDMVPRDSRRVSGSKELLRNRAPRKKYHDIQYTHYTKDKKLNKRECS